MRKDTWCDVDEEGVRDTWQSSWHMVSFLNEWGRTHDVTCVWLRTNVTHTWCEWGSHAHMTLCVLPHWHDRVRDTWWQSSWHMMSCTHDIMGPSSLTTCVLPHSLRKEGLLSSFTWCPSSMNEEVVRDTWQSSWHMVSFLNEWGRTHDITCVWLRTNVTHTWCDVDEEGVRDSGQRSWHMTAFLIHFYAHTCHTDDIMCMCGYKTSCVCDA
jgi:hypothetical protein